MTNFTATVPIANMAAVNSALEAQGFGPGNFSIPVYGATGVTHATMHSWPDAAFQAAVEALPNVTVTLPGGVEEVPSEPSALVTVAVTDVGGAWAGDILPLPDTGTVTAGDTYSYGDQGQEVWSVIQTFSRTTYSDVPATYPALIRQLKNPYAPSAWRQPIDQYDAYKLVNPFTGEPDRCLYAGQEWFVSEADGSGNNVWTPGVFGWTSTTPAPEQPEVQPWVQPTGSHDAYLLDALVTYNGQTWKNTGSNANVWQPGVFGWVVV